MIHSGMQLTDDNEKLYCNRPLVKLSADSNLVGLLGCKMDLYFTVGTMAYFVRFIWCHRLMSSPIVWNGIYFQKLLQIPDNLLVGPCSQIFGKSNADTISTFWWLISRGQRNAGCLECLSWVLVIFCWNSVLRYFGDASHQGFCTAVFQIARLKITSPDSTDSLTVHFAADVLLKTLSMK